MRKNWCIYIVHSSDGSIEIVKDHISEVEAMASVRCYGANARYAPKKDIEWRLDL